MSKISACCIVLNIVSARMSHATVVILLRRIISIIQHRALCHRAIYPDTCQIGNLCSHTATTALGIFQMGWLCARDAHSYSKTPKLQNGLRRIPSPKHQRISRSSAHMSQNTKSCQVTSAFRKNSVTRAKCGGVHSRIHGKGYRSCGYLLPCLIWNFIRPRKSLSALRCWNISRMGTVWHTDDAPIQSTTERRNKLVKESSTKGKKKKPKKSVKVAW